MRKLVIPLMVLVALMFMPFDSFAQTPEEIPISDAISTPPEVGVFQTYDNVLNEDGTYTLSTHPSYFETETGDFIPYRLIDDTAMVQVEIDSVRFVFDKQAGVVTIFDDEGIVIDIDKYIVKSATVNTDVWTDLNVNDSPVVTTVEEIGDSVIVTFTRESLEGIFKTEYVLVGGMAKTTAYFTNLSLDIFCHSVEFRISILLITEL